MSLNVFPASKRRLWPLWLLALIIAGAVFMLWQCWPQILLQSVLWQKTLHQQMTQILQQTASQPGRAGLALMLFSLAYGVLHALGPGHGKVVITTFLATHPARLKTSMKLTLLAAMLQGAVAIGLVTLMLVILQTSSRWLHLSSFWLEKSSYLLVMALGAWIGWRALRALWRQQKSPPGLRIHRLQPQHAHHHHASCGCGHHHVPAAHQVAQAVSWKTQALVIASMGLRPCSGAIMMLLFAKVVGVYLWGVASALAMAAGTALTVSALGLLVQRSRALALRLSLRESHAAWLRKVTPLLMLSGGLALIIAGLLLWQSAQPAFGGGIRPFG